MADHNVKHCHLSIGHGCEHIAALAAGCNRSLAAVCQAIVPQLPAGRKTTICERKTQGRSHEVMAYRSLLLAAVTDHAVAWRCRVAGTAAAHWLLAVLQRSLWPQTQAVAASGCEHVAVQHGGV